MGERGRAAALLLSAWTFTAAAAAAHDWQRVVGDENGDGRWTAKDIQQALDDAGDKTLVLIPPRVFEVEQPIRLGSGQSLAGHRGRSVLRRSAIGSEPLVEIASATGVELRDLLLETQGLPGDRPARVPDLLRLVSVQDVLVEGCRFRGVHDASIAIEVSAGELVYGENRGVTIRGNHARGGRHAVQVGPAPAEGPVDSGAEELIVEGNDFEGSVAAMSWDGLVGDGVIRDNRFGSGLFVRGLLEPTRSLEVSGNRVDGAAIALLSVDGARIHGNHALRLEAGGSGLTITGNVLTGDESEPTLLVDRGSNVVVSGNVVLGGRRGIVLREVAGASVTGNRTRGTEDAIRVGGRIDRPSRRIAVTGNSAFQSRLTEGDGAIVIGRAEECVVSGNFVGLSGSRGPGVRVLEAARDVLVVGNLANKDPGTGRPVASDGTGVHLGHNAR